MKAQNTIATVTKTAIGVAIAAILQTGLAHAGASYAINWSVIAGGGGTSTGGTLSLSGTIGQAPAGPSASGTYTLTGGFWAVETPGAPRLTITRSGGSVIISWPSSATGFTLQSTTDLAAHAAWAAVAQPVTLVGSQYQVTVPATQARQFFRLVR